MCLHTRGAQRAASCQARAAIFGRGGRSGRKPLSSSNFRAQIYRFALFELILLLKLDKRFPVEQFEATASQSTVPSPSYIFHVTGSTRSCGALETTEKQ